MVLRRSLHAVRRGSLLIVQDLRQLRHWPALALFLGAFVAAALRLLSDMHPHLPVLFNWTPSLPFRVVRADYSPQTIGRGDYVVYPFRDTLGDFRVLHGQPLFKRVAGVEGDVVTVVGREVFVNDASVGVAKVRTRDGRALEPIDPVVVPAGYLYVQGTSADSFDSRYSATGLVAATSVRAKVHPLF